MTLPLAGSWGTFSRYMISRKYIQPAQADLESMECTLTDEGCTHQGCGISSRHSSGVRCIQQALIRSVMYPAGTQQAHSRCVVFSAGVRCIQQALFRGAMYPAGTQQVCGVFSRDVVYPAGTQQGCGAGCSVYLPGDLERVCSWGQTSDARGPQLRGTLLPGCPRCCHAGW